MSSSKSAMNSTHQPLQLQRQRTVGAGTQWPLCLYGCSVEPVLTLWNPPLYLHPPSSTTSLAPRLIRFVLHTPRLSAGECNFHNSGLVAVQLHPHLTGSPFISTHSTWLVLMANLQICHWPLGWLPGQEAQAEHVFDRQGHWPAGHIRRATPPSYA